MEWNFKVVSGNRCPRQFEYHPSKQGMIFGTITGEVCAIDIYNGETRDNTKETKSVQQSIPIKSLGYYGKNKSDTMLGLCWLRPPVGEEPGSVHGTSRLNSNLFISGSSQGRVCMGDASRVYDPKNRDKYSIVHDYPVFDRLTSVHVNSTNNLLLMSGYSTGVNIVDLETSQVVRKYENIHSDHVNISRFSNLSPHLLATSSFDSTIKTWDLRQSCNQINGLNQPIYEVKCNSGVVMINFSADDNFILASALDNEINQFMFLDGRKHLTYNLPKTGLKGNFTRAYYSASGRHTLTGACEESTVKLMCTYTGEHVTSIDLYPGKKDKSIYIQSLRGCPIDEDQICVLANYRDMQNRELVVVSRDHHFVRQQQLDQQLPVREEAQKLDQQLPVREEAQRLDQQLPIREEAHQQSVIDWFTPSIQNSARINSIETETNDIHTHDDNNINNTDIPIVIDMEIENHEESTQKGLFSVPETEETEYFQANNSLMTFYSAQYIEHMRSLCSFATSAFDSYCILASSTSSKMVCDNDLCDTALELNIVVKGREGLEIGSYTDLVVLVHTAPQLQCSATSSGSVFILAVHSFILKARCPKLFKLYSTATAGSTTSGSSKLTVTLQCNNEIDTSTSILPTINITSPTVRDTGNTNHNSTADFIPPSLLYLLPLLVDYLYTGTRSVDTITLRYYCLQQLIRRDPYQRSVYDLLIPLVGELLATELQEYASNRKAAETGLFVSPSDSIPNTEAFYSSNNCNGSRNSIQYSCNPTRYFLPIQDPSCVEMLLKVCVDDHCWRQSTTLSLAIVHTVADLLELTRCLELECLESTLSSVLEHTLCPNNAILVHTIAVQYGCTELIRVSLRYIANHASVLSKQLVDCPELHAAVTELSTKHIAQVVSRIDFRDHKCHHHNVTTPAATSTADKRSRSSTLERLRRYLTGEHDSDNESYDHSEGDTGNAHNSSTEDSEFLWMHEELPFLPATDQHSPEASTVRTAIPSSGVRTATTTSTGVRTATKSTGVRTATPTSTGVRTAAPSSIAHTEHHNATTVPTDYICLPRYISTSVVPFLTDHVLFLGGQNLDRLHTFGNRILSYNYTTKEFRYISTGGTHIPKCGYMSSISALQRSHTTHIVALGGKIKKAEISVKHTTLPQHFHTMNTADSSVLDALKPSVHTSTGIHIDNTASVSLMHNRLVDIWNLNADREELSQPSAEASAAASTATLTALNSTTLDAKGNIVRAPKVQELLQSMGAVYELDCVTLTWRSPSVEIISKTQLNTYNAQNIAMRLQYEQEIQRSEDALRHRVAQAVSPLYSEDVSYRCCECLFTTNPSSICACSHSNNGKETTISDTHEHTWLLQFGGFCDKSETILNDLHVLHCERNISSSSSTDVPAAVSEYKYRWLRINATGTAPHGRFSHSSTVIPYDRTQASRSPLHAHTRVLYFGGAGYQPDMSPLCSLRINRSSTPPAATTASFSVSEISYYAHWEEIIVTGGRSPPPVQGHTMVRVPNTNYCILYGGAFTNDQGVRRNTCNPHTWLLCLEDVSISAASTPALHVRWEIVRSTGIPPSLRSRHCSFAVPAGNSSSSAIMVFGGVDEQKLSHRQAYGGTGTADFDEEVKDSILHTLQFCHSRSSYEAMWLPTTTTSTTTHASPFQHGSESTEHSLDTLTTMPTAITHLVYFRNDLSVRVTECALSRDMMSLLDAIFSDTTLCSPYKEGMYLEDEQHQQQGETEQRLRRILKEFHLYSRPNTTTVADTNYLDTSTTSSTALQPSLLIQLLNSNSYATSADLPTTSTTATTTATNVSSLSVYKSLLCTRCQWFNTMFTSNMKESQSTGCIELTDVDPCAFRLLLLYIYTDVLMICSLQDIVAVLELANQFNLTSLAKRCEGALVRLVTLDNACELLDYADTLNLQVLKTICMALLLRDFVAMEVEVVVEGGVQLYKNSGSSSGSKKTVGSIIFAEYMNNLSNTTVPTSTSSTATTSNTTATTITNTTANTQFSEEYLSRIKAIVADFAELSEELRLEIWHTYQLHTQVYCAGSSK